MNNDKQTLENEKRNNEHENTKTQKRVGPFEEHSAFNIDVHFGNIYSEVNL